jgi:hypothetical protein
MKGVVFVALEDLVQERFGLSKWNKIIRDSKIKSEGIYTRGEFYDDKELFSLLEFMSIELKKKKENLQMIFGVFLIKYFYKQYPLLFVNHTFDTFLLSINNIVHSEIKKLNAEASPPEIQYDPETKEIIYKSNRKLCFLAYGLIKGSAEIFNYSITLQHDDNECMLKGCNHCKFIIKEK